MGNGEGNLLLPLEIVGRRAALKIGSAVCQKRNAGGGGYWLQLDLEFAELEVLLHRIDDLVAEVHGVADDLLLVVIVGERNRGFTVADRDRAGILDLLKCAVLCCGGAGEQADGRNGCKHRLQTHRNPRNPCTFYGSGALMTPVAGPYHSHWPESQ